MTAAKPPTRSEVKIALGMAAALLFLVVILSAVLSDPRGFDFAGYYMSGLIIHQGNASRLYDLGEQARIERQLFNRDKILINPHPPFEALGFASLARLSYTKAYVLWGAINVLLWLLSQHLYWRDTPIPNNFFRYCLLSFLFFPLWGALIIGQTTVLLLLVFTLTFVCLRRGQEFKAGILLGLGLFKFPVVLPFALICFLRGKWRLMAGFFAAASLLGVLSVVAVGPAGVRSYLNLMIDILMNPDNPAYISMRTWAKMPTVKGFIATLLTGRLASNSITLLAAAISAPLILFAAWAWRQEDRIRGGISPGLMFAAALVVSQVTAPHFYAYDLTLMLLAVLLVISSPPWSKESGQRTVLTAIMVTLYCPPLFALLLRWQAVYLLAPVLVAFALAAISLARKPEIPLI